MPDEDYLRIQLGGHRRGSVIRGFALIDAEDSWLTQFTWFRMGPPPFDYACRTARMINGVRRSHIMMHRELLGLIPGDGLEGDHIDGDPLNNRRSNLRIVTHAENQQNRKSVADSSSQFRGVSWSKAKRKWIAQVTLNGRMIFLGAFSDEADAARVASEHRLRLMTHTNEGR